MNNIKFNSVEHEMFYGEMLSRAGHDDVYYRAFFYCMGMCPTTRKNIDDLFDFNEGCILPENIHQPYQTGTSYQVTRMAFNLWNGYIEEGYESSTTPSSLFACEYASEFTEALRIRYSVYFKNQELYKSSLRQTINELRSNEVRKSTDKKSDHER
ncbi:DUF6075 family protein [Acidaminobacter sp. JC074]|uniref:DUF6075 family protein n=1 Tax=Acidaminobacter sp. JC074 TaxID=2530199 RepID=UPI001F0F588E|nr:DUF6075 family protein [Acidaminobacter sp. JC074]